MFFSESIDSIISDELFSDKLKSTTQSDIKRALRKEYINPDDLIALLSPPAADLFEDIAAKAHAVTVQYFGRTIQLYTPLYIANYCDNRCIYCGFNTQNNITRKVLSFDEMEKEAQFLSAQGFEHILILTGSSRLKSPVEYIAAAVSLMKKYFSSVSIEVYAMDKFEYDSLIDAGVDGLTIYQEVYDRDVYGQVHLQGPKTDYNYRLDAPSRALISGMRQINIGALLGLSDWRKEVFLTAYHADFLQRNFPDAEIGVSIPRLRPHLGSYDSPYRISDRDIVQIIMALRLFLPRVGITVSTREDAQFRNNILPLGITRMSAGSTTAVAGHTSVSEDNNQFDISDDRSLNEVINYLKDNNYQPVTHDWMAI